MASFQIPIAPVLTKERWVQCENPNCEKWRRIPHDAVIDEDAPWYCYMNPDPERNTCSAAEEVCDGILLSCVIEHFKHKCIMFMYV